MDLRANVKLSQEESELVQNTDWILTKQSVIEKVVMLFGEVSEAYRHLVTETRNGNEDLHIFLKPEPKISKGEQYERLPYVMLDFPRVFDNENVFAIRSLFWWGNFFSINLHVSGIYREQFFSERIQAEKFKDWFVCIHEDPWQHHFRSDNFRPLTEVGADALSKKDFIKLAKKIPLTEWNSAYSFYQNAFREILHNLVS